MTLLNTLLNFRGKLYDEPQPFALFQIADDNQDEGVRIMRPHPNSEGDTQQVKIEQVKGGLALTVSWQCSTGSVTLPHKLILTPTEATLLAGLLLDEVRGLHQ